MKQILFILFAIAFATMASAQVNTIVAPDGTLTIRTNLTVPGTVTVEDLAVNNSLNVSVLNAGTVNYPSYTVATLPVSPTGYALAFCTDAVTSRGTGAFVRWDGSAWLTWENVRPSAAIIDFILNARTAGLTVSTPISNIQFVSDPIGGLLPGRLYGTAGTGAAITGFGSTVYGSSQLYDTGSTAAGVAYSHYFSLPAMGPNDYYAVGGAYFLNTLCTAAEKYYCYVSSFISVTTTNVPVSGCFFLYDMFGVTGIGITNTAASNNWIAVSCKASSYSSVDTGLPVSTSIPATLETIATSSAVYFYTNKVLSVTVSDTDKIPTTSLFFGRTMILKDTGGTTRRLTEITPSYHQRHAARTW